MGRPCPSSAPAVVPAVVRAAPAAKRPSRGMLTAPCLASSFCQASQGTRGTELPPHWSLAVPCAAGAKRTWGPRQWFSFSMEGEFAADVGGGRPTAPLSWHCISFLASQAGNVGPTFSPCAALDTEGFLWCACCLRDSPAVGLAGGQVVWSRTECFSPEGLLRAAWVFFGPGFTQSQGSS